MSRAPDLPHSSRIYPRPPLSERLTHWIRVHRAATALIVFGMVLALVAVLIGQWDRTLTALRLKTDKSLALTSDSQRGEMSRNIVRIAWKRMYWARVFVFRLNAGVPQNEVDLAWSRFNEASAEWNENLIINIKALADFYPGSKKREQFEFDIQGRWLGVSQQLFDLRYRTPKDPVALQNMIDDIHARMDTLNNMLYEFALGEPSPRARK